MTINISQEYALKISKKQLLCIAIPTYSRASRLDRALTDLLRLIGKSQQGSDLSVFVSDNGSTDETEVIIEKHHAIFEEQKIPFYSQLLPENRGFDVNALNCYKNANAEYVWLVSDDDNLEEHSITTIINDIQKFSPSVLFYNFNQVPYNLLNPYIKEDKFYNQVDLSSIVAISKILYFPKLTSLVLKKLDEDAMMNVVGTCGLGFIHVALAIQVGLDQGRIFHSKRFIAHPDEDFMDHIDFPPYIGNNMESMVNEVLARNSRMDFCSSLTFSRISPLTSSMNTLATYYRGNIVLTPELKTELYVALFNEIKNLRFTDIKIQELIAHTLRLFFGYAYNIFSIFIIGRRATKLRVKGKVI
jgi:glycosyltransferase involved in cell wall biosynthesis